MRYCGSGVAGMAKRGRLLALIFLASAAVSTYAAPGTPASATAAQADSGLSVKITTLDGKEFQHLSVSIGSYTDLILWITNPGPPDSIVISDYRIGLIDHLPGEKFQRRLFIETGVDSVHIHITPSVQEDKTCFSMTTLTISVVRLYAASPDGASLDLRFPCSSFTGVYAEADPSGSARKRTGNSGPSTGWVPLFSSDRGQTWFNVDGTHRQFLNE
jgi:hypothetical protein